MKRIIFFNLMVVVLLFGCTTAVTNINNPKIENPDIITTTAINEAKAVALFIPGLNLKFQKMDAISKILEDEKIIVIKVKFNSNLNSSDDVFNNWSRDVEQGYNTARNLMATIPSKNNPKLILVGYSLGAALGLELGLRPGLNIKRNYIYDKMILLAPAITLQWYTSLIKILYIFGDKMMITSRNHPDYIEKSGTYIAEYKALFRVINEIEEMEQMGGALNIPSLLLMDPDDELIDYSKTKQFIEKRSLNKWKVVEVIKDKELDRIAERKNLPKHLIVDEFSMGTAGWKKIKDELISFVNRD
ncbi:MAG: hypothetical protein HQK49_07185 [Oligoflexia bacterium]|nr:hypothetical protein [Oligoflexia bacterium]